MVARNSPCRQLSAVLRGMMKRRVAINVVIVKQVHLAIGVLSSEKLKSRADSFVVGIDVEYSIELRFLADALQTLIKRISRLCGKHGKGGWREEQSYLRKLRRKLNRVLSLKGTNGYEEVVRDYLDFATKVMKEIEQSRAWLKGHSIHPDSSEIIDRFYGLAQKLQDQVLRRYILGETIAHSDKIFPVFEPHTRMISKGKAGVPLRILEDHH